MSTNELAAEILELSAPAFARSVALRIETALDEQETDKSLRSEDWRKDATQRIYDLVASLRLNEPSLFVDKARWLARAYAARGVSVDVARCTLQSLRATIAEDFPGESAATVVETVDQAIDALEAPLETWIDSTDADEQIDARSLSYLALAMDGRAQEAIALVTDAIEAGMSPEDAITKIAMPAQRRIGDLWHRNEVSIAQEHLATNTTLDLLVIISDRYVTGAPEGRTVVIASVAGNAHDIGIRATAVMFRLAGWRSVLLGTDLPANEIAAAADQFSADAVVLCASIANHVKAVRDSVAALREYSASRPVIVGGGVFKPDSELWRGTGADIASFRIETVVQDAAGLIARQQQNH